MSTIRQGAPFATSNDNVHSQRGEAMSNMPTTFTLIDDLMKETAPVTKGILSRTVFADDRLKAVLFSFAQGEELSEHTASMPAVMHFLRGEAKVVLDGNTMDVGAGAWIHMLAGMRHAIQAKTPVTMLLLLLKQAAK